MELVAAVNTHGGVARTRELKELGLTRHQLRWAVASGAITRIRRGVYCLGDRATHVAARAAAHGGSVTCVSALEEYGVWLVDRPSELHVEVGRGSRTHVHAQCSCRTHHTERQATFGVASCADALITAAACLSDESLFVAFESAWRLGLLSTSQRTNIIMSLPVRRRAILLQARGDADSGLESLFRLRLLLLGFNLESQVWVSGVGRVDFRYRSLLIEIDGKANHDGVTERHKDLVRDAAATRAGYRVLRFDYGMIMHDWTTVQETVLLALTDAEQRF